MIGNSEGEVRVLTGWGRAAPSAALVRRPRCTGELEQMLTSSTEQPLIARGLGRSYGDAAQCAGGVVVDLATFDSIEWLDPEAGVVEVGGGVVLHQLMHEALERGWFVPVTPGTRQVTVGGAIAADIHGKNHHRDASFCMHVRRCTLVTPSGTFRVGPAADAELFWATAGGMGLTGIVASAELQLLPVESPLMLVDTERFDDLDTLMATMEESDAAYRYSVAWVDCMGGSGRTGRAVLTRGDHAPRGTEARRKGDGTLPSEPRLKVPFTAPRGILNPLSVRVFNDLWFLRAPRLEVGAPHSIGSFFHPLDGVADWNLLYGPSGFVQYQFVVGNKHAETVRQAISRISSARVAAFLAVLKRFGPGDPGPLSFPMEGWTLALDFPIGPPALRPLLDELDEMVVAAGGRVYLAKDSRLRPELVPAMYPRMGELAAVCERVDPDGRLQSDLSRRLGMREMTKGRHGA